jgi:serine/threonine protein kinase
MFSAPEVLNEEPAFPQTDIWTVGVLTYVMLSGVVPFKGQDENETRQNISFVRYRFEHLYKEISQEGTRFLMLLFKRQPKYFFLRNREFSFDRLCFSKRPSAEECHENRWLLPTEFMIKKRERAIFLGNRLKVSFCKDNILFLALFAKKSIQILFRNIRLNIITKRLNSLRTSHPNSEGNSVGPTAYRKNC